MATSWYYANERDEQIEVEETELERLCRAGQVDRETLVWTEGMGDWEEAGTIRPTWFAAPNQAPEIETASPRPDATEAPAPSSSVLTPGVPELPARGNQSPSQLATAAMITGIIGLAIFFCAGVFALPISIAAVVCGHMAIKRLDRTSPVRGQAVTGIVLGWIGVAFGLLGAVVMAIYMLFVVRTATDADWEMEIDGIEESEPIPAEVYDDLPPEDRATEPAEPETTPPEVTPSDRDGDASLEAGLRPNSMPVVGSPPAQQPRLTAHGMA